MVYIDIIISAVLLSFVFINSVSEHLKIQTKAFIFLSALLCSYLTYTILFPVYLIVLTLLLIIIFSTKNKVINTIGALSGYIISVVVNYILLFFAQLLFHADIAILYSKLIYMLSFHIIYLPVTYVLTWLFGRFLKKYFAQKPSKAYNKTTLLILLEVLICSIILIFNITYGRQIGYPKENIFFNCIFFLIYFVLSTLLLLTVVSAIQKNNHLEQKEQQYEQLQDYIYNLEKSSNQLREFKHDYINTFMALDELIHSKEFDNKQEQLIDFFDHYIKPDSQRISSINTQFMNLSKLKDSPLKSLISSKLNFIAMQQIPVRIELSQEIENIPMNLMDLIRVLGIFLDNATDAILSLTTDQSDIPVDKNNVFLNVAFIPTKDCLEITIQNSCTETPLPMQQIYERGYSTKGSNRGLGLYQVEQILSEYKNILHKTSQSNGIFTQTLLIFSDTNFEERSLT